MMFCIILRCFVALWILYKKIIHFCNLLIIVIIVKKDIYKGKKPKIFTNKVFCINLKRKKQDTVIP